MVWRLRFLLPVLAAASGCAIDLGHESIEVAPFAEVSERCIFTPPPGIVLPGPFSIAFAEGNYFIFGETVIGADPMFAFLHNAGAVGDPCAPDYVRGLDGQLATLIELSEEEVAADVARTDGRSTALWPLSGFGGSGDGFVFYQQVLHRGYFDVATVGTGVARLRYGRTAERLRPEKYASAPTLTWLSPQADWGTGALVAADGLAYVYGCYQRAQLDFACRVARVAPEQVGDPDAYRYFAGDADRWTERVEQAAVVVSGARSLTGVFSPHLGAYVFVYSGFLENKVYAVTAPEPWGPFGEPRLLFEGIAPEDGLISGVNLVPGFTSADGSRLLVSYHSGPSVRFVDVVLK